MKYLKRKSIAKIPNISGSVSDTLNIEDTISNAPSINLVSQMAGVPYEGIVSFNGDTIPEGYEEVNITDAIPLATTSSNGLMSSTDKTKLDYIGDRIFITKSLNLSTANTWYDTGISGPDLPGGVYIIQVDCNSFSGQGGLWQEYYAGVMNWFGGTCNSSNACEVPLHNSGHADNSGKIKIRTLRQPNAGYLKLQISSAIAMTAAKNVIFKFRLIL